MLIHHGDVFDVYIEDIPKSNVNSSWGCLRYKHRASDNLIFSTTPSVVIDQVELMINYDIQAHQLGSKRRSLTLSE